MMMMMMMVQVMPQFTVFSGMLPHVAHLKLKRGVSPSFFMHDELKMVCTALDQLISVDSVMILVVGVVVITTRCSICWCTSVRPSVSHICDDVTRSRCLSYPGTLTGRKSVHDLLE